MTTNTGLTVFLWNIRPYFLEKQNRNSIFECHLLLLWKALLRLLKVADGANIDITLFFIAPACSRVRYRRPIFRQSVRPSVSPSVRLSTFMSTFDIYVKVSILINYKTKQPSNLAWNISLTSWLCNIGVRFSVCLSIRPSVCQHLCRRSTFMSKLVFKSTTRLNNHQTLHETSPWPPDFAT